MLIKIKQMAHRYTLTRRKVDGEFVVRCWKDGKRYEAGDYFTTDWNDAVQTKRSMEKWVIQQNNGVIQSQ